MIKTCLSHAFKTNCFWAAYSVYIYIIKIARTVIKSHNRKLSWVLIPEISIPYYVYVPEDSEVFVCFYMSPRKISVISCMILGYWHVEFASCTVSSLP